MTNWIADSVRRIGTDRPSHIAVVTAEGSLTYGDLVRMWDDATRQLRDLGIGAGDRVLIRTAAHADMFATVLACMSRGAIAVPVNMRASEDRVEQLRTNLGATAFATAAAAIERLEQTGVGQPVGADTHTMIMTSGTTGIPKAVPIHAAMSDAGAEAVRDSLQFDGQSVFLNYTPSSTVGGLYIAGLPMAAMGVTQICVGFAPLEFAAAIAQHRPSHAVMLPVMINVLRSLPSWNRLDLSCLRSVMSGSAPVFEHHVKEVLLRGVKRFVHSYGSSECLPVVARRVSTSPDAEELVAMNEVMPGWEMRFTDEGEMLLRGTAMTRGYANRPAGTGFDGEWFRTGDIFTQGETGLRFVGRADQRLKINAWSVSPEQTEAVIMEVPGVSACVAVKKVGRSGAETLVAMVSGPAVDPAAIMAQCNARLDDHQVPRRIIEVPQVPLNAMGKIDRVAASAL